MSLIESLRAMAAGKHDDLSIAADAAAEIERLRKDARAYANVELSEENDRLIHKIERLRAALKPFADYAEAIDGNPSSMDYPDACPVGLKPEIDGTKEVVHLGDMRRARTALAHQQSARKSDI